MSVRVRGVAAILVCAFAASWPVPADPAKKLDPFLRRLARANPQAERSLPPFLHLGERHGRRFVDLKARIDGAFPEELARAGIELRGRVGEIVSLRVPIDAIDILAARDDVKWLKSARSYRINNEVSTGPDHLASDQANVTFNSGEGVIVAVVDTGIDWTNADFRNPNGTTRLLGIWDQTITDPLHPPPPGFSFGAYYSRTEIDSALSTSSALATGDEHGHGSHVMGTAAGNGRSTGNGVPAGTFAGVAPLADLLSVRVFAGPDAIFCDDCDLVAAVQFITQVAASQGKPWVGNMSLGDSTGGAHDGSSADEIAIDAAVGPGHPGSQLAVSAGNEGRSTRHFHWRGTLAASQTFENTFSLPTSAPDPTPESDFVWLDLWYEGIDEARVEIVTPGGSIVGAERGADSGIVCTPDGAVQVDAGNAPDAENGDNQVFVQIWDSGTCVPTVDPASGTWKVRVIVRGVGAGGGPFDLWDQATARGLGWVDLATFDLTDTVSIPATCRNCVTAGAYVDKDRWTNNQSPQTTTIASVSAAVGARSAFSSVGPTRDGRTKPDISAPGEFVGSTISTQSTPSVLSFQERDGKHQNFRGTSMAAPHVTGTLALLLAVDPTLDGAGLREAIRRSARADAFTGAVPNNAYGWGKLRALEAAYQASTQVLDLEGSAGGGFTGTASPDVVSYNVYRGTIPGLSPTNYGTCFLSDLPTPAFSDSSTPPAGQAFTYLVVGVYSDPTTATLVEGSLGTDSSGRTRPNNFPCP